MAEHLPTSVWVRSFRATTKERHSEVERALVVFLEDHEVNKFTVPISFVPYQDNQSASL